MIAIQGFVNKLFITGNVWMCSFKRKPTFMPMATTMPTTVAAGTALGTFKVGLASRNITGTSVISTPIATKVCLKVIQEISRPAWYWI